MTNSDNDLKKRSVKCKIDVENELEEAYLASSVQAWWFVICRSPWLFYLPHFTHLSSLLFPPPLASMSSPSLRKGGRGEKRAIQGERERATERALLEILREHNLDRTSRRKTETRVKKFNVITNRVSILIGCLVKVCCEPGYSLMAWYTRRYTDSLYEAHYNGAAWLLWLTSMKWFLPWKIKARFVKKRIRLLKCWQRLTTFDRLTFDLIAL